MWRGIGECEFAAAIKEARPFAWHVADRWHVTKNLTEHLDKVVSARWKRLTKAAGETEMPPEPISLSPSARRPRQPVGEARYQQARALREAGLPTGSIAKRLGVGQRTIQHWLAQQHGPYAGPHKPRRSPLDWSTRYLRERWAAVGDVQPYIALGKGFKRSGYEVRLLTPRPLVTHR